MNYCGQPFLHAKNPLAVCGMIDPARVYQCPQCAALAGPTCPHGQLSRTCLLCEMRDENLALRGKVASLIQKRDSMSRRGDFWMKNATELDARLTDCQAVLKSRGHAADCPAAHCSFVGFTGRCGESPAWHSVVKVGHEYQSPPCSESCGYERTTGEK